MIIDNIWCLFSHLCQWVQQNTWCMMLYVYIMLYVCIYVICIICSVILIYIYIYNITHRLVDIYIYMFIYLIKFAILREVEIWCRSSSYIEKFALWVQWDWVCMADIFDNLWFIWRNILGNFFSGGVLKKKIFHDWKNCNFLICSRSSPQLL